MGIGASDMKLIDRALYAITAHLPTRLIALDSGPYLERYYVGKLFGVTFYLHRFVSSDSERHIHNHPWKYGASIVLSGGYIEEICHDIAPTAGPSGCITYRRRVRWFNRVDGKRFHRIHDAKPGTWTLFIHGERIQCKGWGFLERVHDNCTMFSSYPSANSEWYKTAPKGVHSDRQAIKTK